MLGLLCNVILQPAQSHRDEINKAYAILGHLLSIVSTLVQCLYGPNLTLPKRKIINSLVSPTHQLYAGLDRCVSEPAIKRSSV
jgi:hypothetical protein